jgi:hypothetical protein
MATLAEMEKSYRGTLKVPPEDCREILQTSGLAAALKDYGACAADVHYLLEDLAGQMAWRLRLWNGADPSTPPAHFDQPVYLRLPIDLQKRIETTGKPVDAWINALIAKHAPPERSVVPAYEHALAADSPAQADDAAGEDERPDVPTPIEGETNVPAEEFPGLKDGREDNTRVPDDVERPDDVSAPVEGDTNVPAQVDDPAQADVPDHLEDPTRGPADESDVSAIEDDAPVRAEELDQDDASVPARARVSKVNRQQ